MNKFGKAILGTVFTFEETADKPATPATNNNSSANTNKQNDSQNDFSQTATPEYHPMQTAQVGDTQKYKEHFLKVMKDNNLPGPDYYELSSSIDSLIPVISDVKTRFMSAFTMLSATGLTKDKALSSAQTYLTALDNDAANFATSLQQVKAQEVDGQRAQMDANTKQIQDLNLKIQLVVVGLNLLLTLIGRVNGKHT